MRSLRLPPSHDVDVEVAKGRIECRWKDRHEPIHVLEKEKICKQGVWAARQIGQMIEALARIGRFSIQFIRRGLERRAPLRICARIQQSAVRPVVMAVEILPED